MRRHYGRVDLSLVTGVFEANRGVTDGTGHTLENPNRIWPGMVLTLPAIEPPAIEPLDAPVTATHTVASKNVGWKMLPVPSSNGVTAHATAPTT